ncbi:hypothetical protein [Ktedonobacter racemifer]|uniref:Uncharacterized protein n=1 Tax=Ktedonobacter racemifer DSM 44963 TaxID=485913 RepID=D6TS43_KTERA|nr:hypothetical protein [Ktedonobacter racemifer]EFH86116.1 hypothetical protein Krac_7391 [Ktedonobacter racemifer DSM 44963]
MPKKHQQRPAKAMHGRNKAEHSTVITTGTYKKKKTYQEQARLHQNLDPLPQRAKVPPQWVIPPEMNTRKANSQVMMERGESRSGTDSNAHKPRKASRMHEPAERQPEPLPGRVDNFEEDIRPDNFAGANYGMLSKQHDLGLRASDIKELHGKLADFTKDELRAIVIVPLGEYLEQGAKYIDLNEREKGEFTALAERISDEDHYYVPKKQTGYVLWNRLNHIENPARLDEAGPAAP